MSSPKQRKRKYDAAVVASFRRNAFFERRDKEARMTPKKPKFIGEVPLVNRIEGSPDEGQVVGIAKIEELLGGNQIIHMDASGMTAEMLRGGFRVGDLSIAESDDKIS